MAMVAHSKLKAGGRGNMNEAATLKGHGALLAEVERLTSAVVFALWIAICAAAPELIWQGLAISLAHGKEFEVISPLLFGLLSVFFIEPLLHRGRTQIEGGHGAPEDAGPWAPLYRFVVGFVFGLVGMFIHEALAAFLHAEAGSHAAGGAQEAIRLTLSWALVPFAIALAWQAARRVWSAVPLGLLAAASSAIAGWAFDWTLSETLTTAVPCLAIQAAGYRKRRWRDGRFDFVRPLRTTAVVAAIWLALGVAFNLYTQVAKAPELQSAYDWESLFVDARFYFGWCLGLLLVPSPHKAHKISGS
jgi:hypothetical protein